MKPLRETVAELRRLEKEATPGEWEPDFHSYRDGCELRERRMVIYPAEEGLGSNWPLSTDHGKRADANYTLIAAMRNNLGQLLDAADENERLRALLGEARDALQWENPYENAELIERLNAELDK